ncbi:MAG: DUF72 domain-containing protein [Melioribacteraceae bacterium]|nr:DUF72 domain-containing protein [Melioribacteraceae bacterium]
MELIKLNIGTCSWKYDSWQGLVYPEFGTFNYLEEYSKKYNSVEIDQWFWSLHPNNKIILPNSNVVEEYYSSTPENFKFTVKIPNSITLTHPYKSKEINKHFLSSDLMEAFLDSIKMLKSKIGMLMFQFEYLNKQKMSSQLEFQQRLEELFVRLDRQYNYAVEIRNPNFLNEQMFSVLNNHDISFVFLHGYYMPPIFETYSKFSEFIKKRSVIRLHGFDRKGIELKTKKIWNEIVDPKDEDIQKVVEMVIKLLEQKVDTYLNVNNHFEGSAPLTINKIVKRLYK